MPEGTIGGKPLQHLRLFYRANGSLHSQIIAWVKDADIGPVDQALQALKEANPQTSISELVSQAVIQAGAKAKRENRRNRQAS